MEQKIRESYSPKETFLMGKEFGARAKEGEIYCLHGDLGTGKTLFTQGFAQGLGITDHVNSPTFTIVQEYTEGRLPFYHFDVYRIGEVEEMEEIGYEEYFYGKGVCLVEWAELIEPLIPETAVEIWMEKDLKKGFDYRIIRIKNGTEREENKK